jgi:hypothetical protein
MNEDFEFVAASDLQTLHGEEYDSMREELLSEMWQDARYNDEPDYDYDDCSGDYDY